jgi:hypothetical protein
MPLHFEVTLLTSNEKWQTFDKVVHQPG